jgi:hypothetical protein
MPGLLVRDIEEAEERLAFRRAIDPYERSSKRSAYHLLTFEEAAAYEPERAEKERIAFRVLCPTLEFFDGSTLRYYFAGVLLRRFKTAARMQRARKIDWTAFSRDALEEQLLRVQNVLNERPDRGKFLHLVNAPPIVPKPRQELGARGIRNPTALQFQPLPPVTKKQVQAHLSAKKEKRS